MKKIALFIFFSSLLVFLLSCTTEKTSTANPPPAASKFMTQNQTGNWKGYFYSLWSNGVGSVGMTLGAAGNYSVDWSRVGDFTCGVGWSTGSGRTINYNCKNWEPDGGAYLAVYGWTTQPLVEYYIVDNWGRDRPEYSKAGTVTSDGAVYDIYKHQQVDQPSINGTATFMQYWSVRRTQRETGKDATVTVQNHFDAWTKAGLTLGKYHYQIILTEGFGSSSGYVNVTLNQ